MFIQEKEKPPTMLQVALLYSFKRSLRIDFAVFSLISLLPCLGIVVLAPVLGLSQTSCEAPCRFKRHPAFFNLRISSECFIK